MEATLTIRAGCFALVVGVLVAGCTSPVPSSSSSTHWLTCKTSDDCVGVPNASACMAGYCVDPAGARIAESAIPLRGRSPCDPLVDKDGGVERFQIVADVDDGAVMVVTHPVGVKDPGALRMFYGRPPALDERRVIDVEFAGDAEDAGSFPTLRITFEVGVATYSTWFMYASMPLADGGFVVVPVHLGSLDEGNATTPGFTVRWPNPQALPGFSFSCL